VQLSDEESKRERGKGVCHTQQLLDLHNGAVCSQSLMHRVPVIRAIEVNGIVRNDLLGIRQRAPGGRHCLLKS
jgi:hypothetical protein